MTASLTQVSAMLELYEFTFTDLSDRLKCVICAQILKNAKQTTCGCKVCEKCIRNYLSSGPKPCPSNQSECENMILKMDTDINLDTATNREIGNLRATCPFKFCTHNCALKDMIEHIIKCEYREIQCENCGKKLSNKDKSKHDKFDCEMRIRQCPHCNISMRSRELNDIHLNPDRNELCEKYMGVCPNNCEIKIEVNLKNHLAVCLKKKLDCPYIDFKCTAGKMNRDDLQKHLQSELLNHTKVMLDTIKEYQSKMDELKKEVASQQTLIQELLNINHKTTDGQIKLERSLEDLKRKPLGTIHSVERNVVFRNGNFIWKFSDFLNRKIDAENGIRVSVTSDPFYTSDFGYKMCLRIYPHGDGVGKGSHLSVFFALMKGDYDDLLSWPFKQKVTLSILDQDGNQKNHSDTFKPDIRSACYQKPQDECNIASGSPKFIDLSVVMAPPYYKNDTIYLKISVDTLGISKP